jgi:hypothetical protein
MIYMIQYLNARNAAAPALIHYSSESLEGNSRNVTKFVECPVVLRVPALCIDLKYTLKQLCIVDIDK